MATRHSITTDYVTVTQIDITADKGSIVAVPAVKLYESNQEECSVMHCVGVSNLNYHMKGLDVVLLGNDVKAYITFNSASGVQEVELNKDGIISIKTLSNMPRPVPKKKYTHFTNEITGSYYRPDSIFDSFDKRVAIAVVVIIVLAGVIYLVRSLMS